MSWKDTWKSPTRWPHLTVRDTKVQRHNDQSRSTRTKWGLEPRLQTLHPLLFLLNPPSLADHCSLRMLPTNRFETPFPFPGHGRTKQGPLSQTIGKQVSTYCREDFSNRIRQKCCGKQGVPHHWGVQAEASQHLRLWKAFLLRDRSNTIHSCIY